MNQLPKCEEFLAGITQWLVFLLLNCVVRRCSYALSMSLMSPLSLIPGTTSDFSCSRQVCESTNMMKHSTAGSVFVFYIIDLGSSAGTLYGPQSPPGLSLSTEPGIKSWAPSGISPKTEQQQQSNQESVLVQNTQSPLKSKFYLA